MGNLSEFVPEQSKTVQEIYAWHKKRGDAEPQRGYLGASIVGHECDRYLWFTFRGLVSPEFSGRLYRLFQTGDLEEARFVAELRGIGCEVIDTDPSTGEQLEVNALGGHFSGHMDAAIKGIPEAPKTWHVGEFKTHNAKSFARLKKVGVRASKPQHWAQMQAYMGHTGMTRALYLARNKDTDELYGERIKFDAPAFKALMERAGRIIRAIGTPDRCATRPDDFRCKWCDAFALCWGVDQKGEEPDAAVPIPRQTCRSCVHSTPDTESEGARWICERYEQNLETTDVGAECPSHLLLPGLVTFAEPTDSSDDWIEFTNRDGSVWLHGSSEDSFSTRALLAGPGPRSTKTKLPMALEGGDPKTLLDRYPWQDSERVWDGPGGRLVQAIQEHLGVSEEELEHFEPLAVQDDAQVYAREHEVNGSGYLVVLYKPDDVAAIWKGKE